MKRHLMTIYNINFALTGGIVACDAKRAPAQQRFFLRVPARNRKEVKNMFYTNYGVVVILPDGRRIEVATDEEALELLADYE